jgi:hypothetical protein
LDSAHTVLGTIIIVLFIGQPILGFLHHRHFVRTNQRGIFSLLHIWYGRVLLLFGIITGGTGLQLAGAATPIIVAYVVVVLAFTVLYVICKVFVSRRKEMSNNHDEDFIDSVPKEDKAYESPEEVMLEHMDGPRMM